MRIMSFGSPGRARRVLLVFVATLAVCVVLPFPVVSATAAPVTRYISPTGAGSHAGTSWANAATLADLPALVAAVGPGGQVLLRSDAGEYRVASPVVLRRGGAVGSAVTIRGSRVDGGRGTASLRGTRTSPYRPDGAIGSEVFRLLAGADHLAFRDLAFNNVGNGAFRVGADITGLDIQRIRATNVRRFLENLASGSAQTATISGLIVRDVIVRGFSRGAIRLQYDTHDVLIEDVLGDSEQQDADNFAIGVHMSGTVHDVVLRQVAMNNAQDTVSPYWNGDGFAAERETYNLHFEDTTAFGNTDAGYDLKSTATSIVRASAVGNKRNYRLWGRDITVRAASAADPIRRGGSGGQAQFWFGPASSVTLVGAVAHDASPATVVFDLEAGASVTVSGSVTLAPVAKIARAPRGSDLDMTDVLIERR